MKYYIIAGETSGDIHGANLMRSLLKSDPKADFRFWGGYRMKQAGGTLVKHYKDLAFMGFIEVLFNLKTIMQNISLCKNELIHYLPDVLILIDYPGFNLRIAEFAHKKNIKVVYYISPQVWAWKKNRVHTIKRVVDKMIVILPFEKDFYKKHGIEVDFVGHPLLDAIQNEPVISPQKFREQHQLGNQPIIALLPGSRKQEVAKMLEQMLKMIPYYPNHQFVVGGVNTLHINDYKSLMGDKRVNVVFNDMQGLLRASHAALVTSGTATLETALLKVPEVVCYKGNVISFMIAKRIVDIKYISLVNLIMDKEVVKELIQHDLNEKNMKSELDLLLFDNDYRDKLQKDYQLLIEKLGNAGASDRAAKIIMDVVKA